MDASAQDTKQQIANALRANPDQPRLWKQLAYIYYRANDIGQAAECFRQTIRFDPTDCDALHDLGVTLKWLGRIVEAEAMLRESIRRNPAHSASDRSLAELLQTSARFDEAEDVYRAACERQPASFDVFRDFTNMLLERNRAAEAEQMTRDFISRNGQTLDSLSQLVVCFEARGDLDSALELTAYTIEKRPPRTLEIRLASYLSTAGQIANFEHRARAGQIVREVLPASFPTNDRAAWRRNDIHALRRMSYSLPYYQIDDASLMRVFTAIGDQIGARTPRLPPAAPAAAGPLRVGFVSHNFTNHPIGHLLSPFFEAHGASGADLYLYSHHRNRHDVNDYAGRIAKTTPHFRDCRGSSNEQIAALIRADAIQILVDLDGYLAGGRPELFAMRPAPVQIHWLQHLAGMPAPFIDYTITDRILVKDHERDNGNGPLIRLADAFQCGDRMSLPARAAARDAHGLPESAFVFCAFGAWLKIDEEVFSTWLHILEKVPGSVLWLSVDGNDKARGRLKERLAARGLAPERLVFAPRLDDKVAHLDRHRCADLFLDTFSFSAATTTMDALWAGLPVLTRPGPTAQSRLSEAHLRAVGMTELIAPDTAAYVETALRLANDKSELDRLTKRLKLLVPESPLFDAERMAKQFGQIYADVWSRHIAGSTKTHFDVELN